MPRPRATPCSLSNLHARSSASQRKCKRSYRSRRRSRSWSANGSEALPEDTRPLLELVSAIERPTPALLGKALGDQRGELLADEAVRAGAIAVGSDGVVRFTHPLLGAAVYFEMPPGRRREVHLQAAALVDELEQQARHLALATSAPDEVIAGIVERAAFAAAERGAPDAAGVLAAEAVRLTPRADEPARVRRRLPVPAFSWKPAMSWRRGRASSRFS